MRVDDNHSLPSLNDDGGPGPVSLQWARSGQSGRIKGCNALRIALVFPPAMPPTSPPLGIAHLKSYLESAATVEVQNFDLNLAYFEQAFQWLGDGRLRMRIKKMNFDTTAEKAMAAKSFFKGDGGLDSFFDLPLYNEHAGIYAGFGSVLDGLFDSFARKMLAGLTVPPLVKRFFNELIEPVRAFRPHLVGFSILFSQQLFFALALARLCKCFGSLQPEPTDCLAASARPSPDYCPVAPPAIETKTVFGGATFSVMPDPGRLLTGPVAVYQGGERREVDLRPLIDYLIVGEGERGLESLARSFSTDFEPHRIPGLLSFEQGNAAITPPEASPDLNVLPLPDFSDFPLDSYHSPIRVLPYLSSRGCPWKRCAFCTHQKTYLDCREESAAATAERLFALKEKYGVSHFCLVDEMVHPHRLDRIAEKIVQRDLTVFFSAYAKPAGFSPRVIEHAHRAGLRLMMWGLESASQRVLDLMRKGTKVGEIATVLKLSSQAGIWNLVFLIFGFPTETKIEWLGTLDFLESCSEWVHALSRSQFILLEGSDVFINPSRYGIRRIIDRPRRDPVSIAYDYEVTEGITQQEATEMFRESRARLSTIGRSPWFGQFREHMLLFASH